MVTIQILICRWRCGDCGIRNGMLWRKHKFQIHSNDINENIGRVTWIMTVTVIDQCHGNGDKRAVHYQ